MSTHNACRESDHKWTQAVAYVLGEDRCARKGCDATRTNPQALPPAGWPFTGDPS